MLHNNTKNNKGNPPSPPFNSPLTKGGYRGVKGGQGGFLGKKILIALVAILVIFYGTWLIFPKTSIQSIIEDSISHHKLSLEVEGLKKGLFYNLRVDRLTLNGREEYLSINDIHVRINPLSLILLRLNLSFVGDIGGGNISGHVSLAKNNRYIEINVEEADISVIPLLQLAGIQGRGTISGRFTMTGSTGHVEFFTEDAVFEPAVFSGIAVPLNLFHTAKGSMDIKGNTINIASFALEGEDIYARLKGAIKDGVMDLNIELMPNRSFIENPLFLGGLEKYKISPGYYIIPVKRNL
jgi:type II secretion system protein N